ncbi:MAG: hypothetical protein RH942_03555 [Kiloniellaceae bacterium]
MVEATSLAREMDEQHSWRLLPQFADLRVFDQLLANEFRDPEDIARGQATAVSRILEFAAAKVPYYRRLFDSLGIVPRRGQGLAVLGRLPLLTKADVQDHKEALRATALPQGQKVYGWAASSGTTGRPTRVLHSVESNLMYNYLEQRQLRWFRWNPRGLRADIRISTQFPPTGTQEPPQLGSSFRMNRWRYVGQFFETGDYTGLCVTAPLEAQIEWLQGLRPAYLMAYPSTFERLAHALGPAAGDIGLRGVYAISEQITASMRRRIEGGFGLAVDQTYGLNEAGKVAQRCRAGRYHVNAEHCYVEILDNEGVPCKAGESGRLVITSLRNLAMPLLRYDSGDLAEAVEGDCPCGMTLPSFGPITGRYRRMAGAPEGTSLQVFLLKKALESMPPEVCANLRQYQIRQKRDGSYVILLKIAAALPDAFEDRLQHAWRRELPDERPGLVLQTVEDIPLSPSGKVEDFISDIATTDML